MTLMTLHLFSLAFLLIFVFVIDIVSVHLSHYAF